MTILDNLLNKFLISLALATYPIAALLQEFYAWKEKRHARGFMVAFTIGLISIFLGVLAWTAGKTITTRASSSKPQRASFTSSDCSCSRTQRSRATTTSGKLNLRT